AECIRGGELQSESPHRLADDCQPRGILRSARGNEHLAEGAASSADKAVQRIRNRTCGQGRSGRHHVPAFRTPAMFQELADKLPSKLLAPRSFGRFVAEERRT